MRGGCRLRFTEARLRSDCEIGDAGAAALAGALENNTVLLDLNLAGEYVVVVIVFRCWKLWCLYFLLFVKVWFGRRVVRGGCRLCFTEARLRSGCEIGDAGAAALAGALEKNTVLRELIFSGEFVVVVIVFRCWKLWCSNFLPFVKVWFGRRVVRGGCRLCFTEARLRSEQIGDAGTAALAGALEKNTVLQKVYLAGEYVVVVIVFRCWKL